MILAGYRPGSIDNEPARDVVDVMFVILAEQARRDDDLFCMVGHPDKADRMENLDRRLGMSLEAFEEEWAFEEEDDEPPMTNLILLKSAIDRVNSVGVSRGR